MTISVKQKLFVTFYSLYEFLAWNMMRPLLFLYCRPVHILRKIGSVLHISFISHKPYMLSRLMRDQGIYSSYLALSGERGWLKSPVGKGYDYNLPGGRLAHLIKPWLAIYYLCTVLRNYDVLHYHFLSFLSKRGYELPYLRRMGKIIVFHFRGCEARRPDVNMRLHPDLNLCQECDYPAGFCNSKNQELKLALARKYADLLFITTPDLHDCLPQAEHIPFIAPYGIDLNAITPAPRDDGVFRIVTSSNHHALDGTRYVREAVQQLRREGNKIELVEVHKTPYQQALAIYKSADVYVGKLRLGYYNNAIIECMAMGVPCMCYIRKDFLKDIEDSSIIVTRPENVYKHLTEYINKPEKLEALGKQGPDFVEKHHAPEYIFKLLFQRYYESCEKKYAE